MTGKQSYLAGGITLGLIVIALVCLIVFCFINQSPGWALVFAIIMLPTGLSALTHFENASPISTELALYELQENEQFTCTTRDGTKVHIRLDIDMSYLTPVDSSGYVVAESKIYHRVATELQRALGMYTFNLKTLPDDPYEQIDAVAQSQIPKLKKRYPLQRLDVQMLEARIERPFDADFDGGAFLGGVDAPR